MKLGVVADIRGNDVALRAVLEDAGRFEVERWWALGDLVLFGPLPGEVLEILRELPGIGMLRGNVIGGHTHSVTDRVVGGGRALNPGSTGLPRPSGVATWLLLHDEDDGLAVTQHSVPFDVEAVVADLHRRRHPQTEFVTSVLTGRHLM